jgi:hypothetical protein
MFVSVSVSLSLSLCVCVCVCVCVCLCVRILPDSERTWVPSQSAHAHHASRPPEGREALTSISICGNTRTNSSENHADATINDDHLNVESYLSQCNFGSDPQAHVQLMRDVNPERQEALIQQPHLIMAII